MKNPQTLGYRYHERFWCESRVSETATQTELWQHLTTRAKTGQRNEMFPWQQTRDQTAVKNTEHYAGDTRIEKLYKFLVRVSPSLVTKWCDVNVTDVDHEGTIARLQSVVVCTDVSTIDWHCPMYIACLYARQPLHHCHASPTLRYTCTTLGQGRVSRSQGQAHRSNETRFWKPRNFMFGMPNYWHIKVEHQGQGHERLQVNVTAAKK